MIHEVELAGYDVKYAGDGTLTLGTWDSYGIERLHITADSDWDGLTILATFRIGSTSVRALMDGEGMVEVPPEATSEAGSGVIVFSGTDGEMLRVSRNLRYKVLDHDPIDGEDSQPTPSEWEQLVGRVDEAKKSANESAKRAEQSADSAAGSATAADASARQAAASGAAVEADKSAAQTAAQEAKKSETAAAGSASAAAASKNSAAESESAAASSAGDAASSKTAAAGSASAAATSASAAAASQAAAENSQKAAESSASASASSASNAKNSETSAAASAAAAARSAEEASTSAVAASNSESSALESKNAASGSASAAASSAEEAKSSQSAASESASQAASSKMAAESSASAAAASAEAAASSKTAAADSASAAAASESNAASSKTAAESSASEAADSALQAAASESAAASSAARAEEAAKRAEQVADFDPADFATAEQGKKADTAVQPAQLDDYAQKSDVPQKLPNPQALSIQLGASGTPTTYDGNDAKSMIVTPSAIGALQVKDGIYLYKAILELDAWTGDGHYAQTATLTPMDGGPAVTAQSQIMSGVMCEQTASQETNEALQEVLGIINAGQSTLGAGTVTATVFDKPEADIEAIWQIRRGRGVKTDGDDDGRKRNKDGFAMDKFKYE